MKLTRRQLRRLILREVRLMEQSNSNLSAQISALYKKIKLAIRSGDKQKRQDVKLNLNVGKKSKDMLGIEKSEEARVFEGLVGDWHHVLKDYLDSGKVDDYLIDGLHAMIKEIRSKNSVMAWEGNSLWKFLEEAGELLSQNGHEALGDIMQDIPYDVSNAMSKRVENFVTDKTFKAAKSWFNE